MRTSPHRLPKELFTLSDELYLEAMKPAQAELIVGVMRDPTFGLALTIGSGGILVELLKDSQTLMIPASAEEIGNAVKAPQISTITRRLSRSSKEPISMPRCRPLSQIQQYAIANSGSLLELDVNPLLIGAQGEGVFAADALIVLQEQNHV